MKSRRRQELKTNALGRAIDASPAFFREHGSKVLLGVIAVLLVAFLIRYRITSGREQVVATSQNLANARLQIGDLQLLALMNLPDQEAAQRRDQAIVDARDAISTVVAQANDSGDPTLMAEALIARGDLNWALADLADPPGATTQPALRLQEDRGAALAAARDAYQQVIDRYGTETMSVVAARFGMAAIAEQQQNWEGAQQQYQAIKDMPEASAEFKSQADIRLQALNRLREPMYLAVPATQPSTFPAVEAGAPATTRTR